MRKILAALLLLFLGTCAFAVEIKIEGKGKASLVGYNIKEVRNKQDKHMDKKAKNSHIEALQNQQINEAIRQANQRKKQDEKLNSATRGAVVEEAQQNALESGIKILVDRTLGAGASEKAEVKEKFKDIVSQSSTYILDEDYSGEVIDSDYVAKAYLTIDETAFRELISDLGIAINTANIRSNTIMIILDEFFTRPSDLSKSVLKKEVTTYDYNYDEKLKDTEKASSSLSASDKSSSKRSGNYNSRSSGGYSSAYGGGGYSSANRGAYSNSANSSSSLNAKSNYGKFVDYSKKENESFKNVKEFDVLSPTVSNLNYTVDSLTSAFEKYDIRKTTSDIFKSKYFKGKPITSDKLANSAELASYVTAARKEANADFFAIGVSYIVDKGKNENTGKNECDGQVFIKVYSTLDGEIIASGTFSQTASGGSADQARAMTAQKVGNELGEVIAKKIQDYFKKRQMYGSEYIVQIKGSFMPVEKMAISKALNSTQGIKSVKPRIQDESMNEYAINYSGDEAVQDAVFMQLYTVNPEKFKNYDYKVNGNQIIFSPLKKGTPNLWKK